MITTLDKTTALVLIDLQKAVLRRKSVHPMEGVIKNSALLLAAFRKAGLPVIVVSVNPFGAAGLKLRKQQLGLPKSKLAQGLLQLVAPITGYLNIVKEIHTAPGDIFIVKKTWNAFYNTSLQQELEKRNITGIVIAGVSTSIGVEGTARAACERGYNLSFATDAMTDMTVEAHNNSVGHIFPRLGEQGTTAEIIKHLER